MFKDRQEAGNFLAQKLLEYKNIPGLLVLAIPRGGVSVARPVSRALGADLGVVVAKKVPAPGQPELAIGAVGPEGSATLDDDLIRSLGLSRVEVDRAVRQTEVTRRDYSKRFGERETDFGGKTVVVVDDGAATGSTVEVIVDYLKKKGVKKIVVALPVASRDVAAKLRHTVDELVVLRLPVDFKAVSQFYVNFPQVTDDEVIQYLEK